jgi:hypothetical protein
MVQEKHLVRLLRISTYVGIILVAWCLLGCSHGGEHRLYVHDADRQLFIRDLANKDVLTYEQADGLICQKPEDMKKLMEKGENNGRRKSD